MTQRPLLTVDDLWVRFPGRNGPVEAVRGIGFEVGREKVGIVGESGSGKTLTGRAILRLVPRPGQVTARRLEFDGIDLLGISERGIRRVRSRREADDVAGMRQVRPPDRAVRRRPADAVHAERDAGVLVGVDRLPRLVIALVTLAVAVGVDDQRRPSL